MSGMIEEFAYVIERKHPKSDKLSYLAGDFWSSDRNDARRFITSRLAQEYLDHVLFDDRDNCTVMPQSRRRPAPAAHIYA